MQRKISTGMEPSPAELEVNPPPCDYCNADTDDFCQKHAVYFCANCGCAECAQEFSDNIADGYDGILGDG